MLACIVLLLAGLSAPSTAEVVLERLERDSLGRALIFCSHMPQGWKSELSPDKQRVRLTLPAARQSPQLRPRSWTDGTIRELYPKAEAGGITLYVGFAHPSGYTVVWLPFSRCFLLTPVQWETLTPQEDLYHSALLALELGADSLAESLLSQAAAAGSADAATLLGIRALHSGAPQHAVSWLRRAIPGSSQPDLYAAIAQLAQATGNTALQAWASTRFRAYTQRELPPPLSFAPESTAALTELALQKPLFDTTAFAPLPEQPAAEAPPSAPVDSTATASFSQGMPSWLLLVAPLFFALLGLAVVAIFIRSFTRMARRQPSRTTEAATEASTSSSFPAYVQSALQRYRAAAETPPAEEARSEERHSEPAVEPAPEPPVPEAPATVPADIPPAVAQLWRHRIRQRFASLRHSLQQLQLDSLPVSARDRARLARQLQIPQEGLELHLRLRRGEGSRTQAPSSFVSAPAEKSHHRKADG